MENNLSFEDFFKSRNPLHTFLISRMRCAMEVEEVTYNDINTVNLRKFKEYMEGEVSNNSLKTYFAITKATLNELIYEGLISNPHCIDVLKVKGTPSQHCCMTEDELMKFEQYMPRTDTERDVKILFMRGALSGARSCDCAVMSTDNVSDGLLTYVSKKTKIGVMQPVHNRLVKYLTMKPTKEHKRAVVNRVIQDICKRLGFNEPVTLSRNGKMVTKPKYEWLTMHASRRSYATSLAVRGVPVETIAKLCGHSTSTTTSKHYICIDTKDIGEAALDFFKS